METKNQRELGNVAQQLEFRAKKIYWTQIELEIQSIKQPNKKNIKFVYVQWKSDRVTQV